MILMVAVGLGLIAGLIRAKITNQSFQAIHLRGWWLVIFSFVFQYLAVGFRPTSIVIQDAWVPYLIVGSQVLLVVFVWLNRRVRVMWLLGLGLAMNLLVIVANGGWMPISPETLTHLEPQVPIGSWEIGTRYGFSKDMILSPELTNLALLSDRFILPISSTSRIAFSIGDILLALGAFWLLWSLPKKTSQKGVLEL
jgi:hypothetical protein